MVLNRLDTSSEGALDLILMQWPNLALNAAQGT